MTEETKKPSNPPIQSMTIRDYFAAKAMQGLLVVNDYDLQYTISAGIIAKLSYELADEMLKQREGNNG